jgi:hypothetical protein
LTVLRKRLLILSEVVVEHVQDGTLDGSVRVAESALSEGLGPHARRERHERMAPSSPLRLLVAILRPSHGVSDGNVRIAPSVQRDDSEIAGTEMRAVREAATVVSEALAQIDLNGSGPSDLNVDPAVTVTTVDSDVEIAPTELSAIGARARAVNDSMTDESARVVSEDLAMPMVPRMRDRTRVLSLIAMSVALVAVGQMTVLADDRTGVMTGSVDVQTLIVVARGWAVEDNLAIASSPLRGQT